MPGTHRALRRYGRRAKEASSKDEPFCYTPGDESLSQADRQAFIDLAEGVISVAFSRDSKNSADDDWNRTAQLRRLRHGSGDIGRRPCRLLRPTGRASIRPSARPPAPSPADPPFPSRRSVDVRNGAGQAVADAAAQRRMDVVFGKIFRSDPAHGGGLVGDGEPPAVRAGVQEMLTGRRTSVTLPPLMHSIT